ncbi:TPA: hypothetical protein EYG96_02205 [Candidatus Gracilibacteria bacterium]|nr:hypothetical protein [Candidatus Peregrinibacteria bacterium]HIQ56834.1 hypothetical protein [Candidatus Gracilibacteria bacterium]HIQ57634.1 hypothetical protein [Candidatus Gracilibacteria bacterium]
MRYIQLPDNFGEKCENKIKCNADGNIIVLYANSMGLVSIPKNINLLENLENLYLIGNKIEKLIYGVKDFVK